MKPFRLALVRQKYRPDGGAERFISRALLALEQQNLELNVITREWQGETHPDWHIHLCNPVKLGRISRERGFARAARALWLREQFDLVQSHERIAGCDIYRAGDGVHRNWLLQRARLLPSWRHPLLMNSPYHRFVMQAESDMYSAPELKAVICNAEMIKREIVEQFEVAPEKITVIYNAIDHHTFHPADMAAKRQLRLQYQLPEQSHCLIFVGSGFERKGLEAAIRAVAPTESYLVVIGRDKNEKAYRALASSLGCQSRIRFMGVQKDTLPFYQAVDGLLLPTLYDPFPNVILEAMACGLPVITSTTCGGAEFIREGLNGFVTDALNVHALTAAVQQLPREALDSSMGRAAREHILPYNPPALSSQLIGLYQRVLAQ